MSSHAVLHSHPSVSKCRRYFSVQQHVFARVLRLVMVFLFIVIALLATRPNFVRIAFPAGACIVGYLLYKWNESYYLSYILWIMMLAPLLRRLVDWRTSYQEQSLILLAPLLICFLPAIHLRRRLAAVAPIIRTVALLTFSSIAYGFGIGMIKHPGPNVILAAATWSAPIMLCIFAASIRERAMLAAVLTKTFLCGVLLMSVYGVYQFVVAPPWDTYWLTSISSGLASISPSFGQPKPFGIRVWSTMNAPGPLSVMLSAALIWLATRDTLTSILIALCGYTLLLLTMGRSAWLQTLFGLILLIAGCRPRLPLRGMAALLIMLLLLTVGVQQLPQASDIKTRLQSFSSLHNDASTMERRDLYRYMAELTLTNPTGEGLDTTYQVHGYPLDSSLILILYMTGWLGALCYFGALANVTVHMLFSFRNASKTKVAASAIALSSLTQLTSGDVLLRQGGLIFWLFVGIWGLHQSHLMPTWSTD